MCAQLCQTLGSDMDCSSRGSSQSLFAGKVSFHFFCDYMKGDRDTCIMYVVSNTVNSILFSLIVEEIVPYH